MIRTLAVLLLLVSSAWADWADSVCRVRVPEGGASSLGSGSLVEWEGHSFVLTNQHVVAGRRGDDGVWLEWPRAGIRRRGLVLLAERDDDLDLAVIAVEGDRVPLRHFRVAEALPAEPVTLYGFGGGSFLAQQGRIRPGGSWAFIDRQPRSGDSGGPIATADGRLVAVVWGGGGGLPGQGVACRPTPIRNLLARVVRGIAGRPLPRNYCVGPRCGSPGWIVTAPQPTLPPIPRNPIAETPPKPQTAGCDCSEWKSEVEDRLAAIADAQEDLAASLDKLADRTTTIAGTQSSHAKQLTVLAARETPDLSSVNAKLAALDKRLAAEENRRVTLEVLQDGEPVGSSTGREIVRLDLQTLTGG